MIISSVYISGQVAEAPGQRIWLRAHELHGNAVDSQSGAHSCTGWPLHLLQGLPSPRTIQTLRPIPLLLQPQPVLALVCMRVQ